MSRRKVLALRESNGRIPFHKLANGSDVAVYVMSIDDVVVKIGRSANPSARALAIQTAQDREVSVYWAVRLPRLDANNLEKHVHRRLRATLNHSRGEWYMMAPETAKAVIESAIVELGLKSTVDIIFGWGRE